MDETVPDQVRLSKNEIFKYGKHTLEGVDSGNIIVRHMFRVAQANKTNKSYIGQGYYPSISPTVIIRNMLENPKWYTPYTPYQAEISQGRLESLLNYQTMICELTGLDVSNASLLDEATACAEAVTMAFVHHNGDRKKFYVSDSMFPQTLDVLQTRAFGTDVEVVIGPTDQFPWEQADEYCGMLVQNPDNFGNIHNFAELCEKLREKSVVSVICADILSMCIVKPPGEMGADIAVGSV